MKNQQYHRLRGNSESFGRDPHSERFGVALRLIAASIDTAPNAWNYPQGPPFILSKKWEPLRDYEVVDLKCIFEFKV